MLTLHFHIGNPTIDSYTDKYSESSGFSLLPEVISSKLSHEQLQLLYSLSSTLASEMQCITCFLFFFSNLLPRPIKDTPIKQAVFREEELPRPNQTLLHIDLCTEMQ